MITNAEIILRLLVSAILAMTVGYKHEKRKQPAGLRTHTILVIGSCLSMTISINLAKQYQSLAMNNNPARLAAQVISVIGFLSAGAILRFGPYVKGLTTASSLWTMAIIGLAVGVGHYVASIAATVLILAVLPILNPIENRFIRGFKMLRILLSSEKFTSNGSAF